MFQKHVSASSLPLLLSPWFLLLVLSFHFGRTVSHCRTSIPPPSRCSGSLILASVLPVYTHPSQLPLLFACFLSIFLFFHFVQFPRPQKQQKILPVSLNPGGCGSATLMLRVNYRSLSPIFWGSRLNWPSWRHNCSKMVSFALWWFLTVLGETDIQESHIRKWLYNLTALSPTS